MMEYTVINRETGGTNAIDLKELVFFRANAEVEAYMSMQKGYTEEEKQLQRQRFEAIYQIIEEAELKDEYAAWKEQQN